MLMSVEELRKLVTTEADDAWIQARLSAIESMIRQYTNNRFQIRGIRSKGDVVNGEILMNTSLFHIGDTIEISNSKLNAGLYVIASLSNGAASLDNPPLFDEEEVLVTKVVYPEDVKVGVANLIAWEIGHRDKVGIKSETISRHTITYYDNDTNSLLGYPRQLMGFLKLYMKARF